MYSCLLKKLVPFALTFVVGAAIGGLFNSFGWRSTPAFGGLGVGQSYRFERRYSCRMHTRNLVAETKPLVILFKPDAVLPYMDEMGKEGNNTVLVRVTFGADGMVQNVQQLQPLLPDVMLKAVDRAARQIQFTPETINSVPISVTRDIEIRFMPAERR